MIKVRNAELQRIGVTQEECAGGIKISMPCPIKASLEVAIDSKVPKALSILPPATSAQFETSALRDLVKLFVDVDGVAHYATLEQLKQLNTKTVYVDTLTDSKINTLSNDDIILLEER